MKKILGIVAGDRVKREGHCSEYEKSEIAKEK